MPASAGAADFLFTCKPESHATLHEWVSDFERNGQLGRVVQVRRVGKKRFTDTYRYVQQVPLRNTDDAVSAFLVHTALDWMDSCYAMVRSLLPSRRTFFEHLRALLLYLPCDDWHHLLCFMQQRLVPNAPKTG